MTRESVWRQNGQCIVDPLAWRFGSVLVDELVDDVLTTCGEPAFRVHNMWTNYIGVTTRCSGYLVPL